MDCTLHIKFSIVKILSLVRQSPFLISSIAVNCKDPERVKLFLGYFLLELVKLGLFLPDLVKVTRLRRHRAKMFYETVQ